MNEYLEFLEYQKRLQKKFVFIVVNVEGLENTRRKKNYLLLYYQVDYFNILMFLKLYFLNTYTFFSRK